MPQLTDERVTGAREDAVFDKRNATHVMTMRRTRTAGRLDSWRRMAMMLLLLVCGCGSQAAFAQSVSCSVSGTTTYTITMPSTTNPVPRDAPPGTLLTPWVTTPQNTYFTCSVTGSAASGAAYQSSFTKTGLTVTGPNGSRTVWQTNVAGVGIAIGVKPFANGCINGAVWLNLGAPSGFLPAPWVAASCNQNGSVANGGQLEVALVKTGTIAEGAVVSGVIATAASITSTNVNGTYTVSTTVQKSIVLTSTTISVAACTTPDVTVNMGSYQQSVFKGVGSATTPAVSFNIAVNACPTGLTKIQYQFIPLNAVLDATNGVLALSSSSTATGIGVQLKDGSGNALKYNTQYTLSGYNTSTGGSYTIPLTAAYYQTAPAVTPGSANAVLTFTMTYQ
jgi:major type 1 subunit fimbrin (pilin)